MTVYIFGSHIKISSLTLKRRVSLWLIKQDAFMIMTGQYLEAEVDGNFGRDVIEFLVRGDVAAYRIMATKVTYVYPFTTALGDSKGQEERMRKIIDQLHWYSPTFDSMDD